MFEGTALAVVDGFCSHALCSAVVEEGHAVIATNWVNRVVADTLGTERGCWVKPILDISYESQEVYHVGAVVTGSGLVTPALVGECFSCFCQLAHVLVSHVVRATDGEIDVGTTPVGRCGCPVVGLVALHCHAQHRQDG